MSEGFTCGPARSVEGALGLELRGAGTPSPVLLEPVAVAAAGTLVLLTLLLGRGSSATGPWTGAAATAVGCWGIGMCRAAAGPAAVVTVRRG
ncbi:hypothetical protein [Streptomyces bluensis]|uniref:Uncharacterized protein n=1 Tax=Streptomyces bluensis TaxID=33897 RepID=A0ABW6UKU4_9ACTN